MNLILKRMEALEPLPVFDGSSVTIFDEASALFGYKVPQNEKRRKASFLRVKLQEMNILPFIDESVWKYQMAAVSARTLELAEGYYDGERAVSKVSACLSLLAAIIFLIPVFFFFEQKPEVRIFAGIIAVIAGVYSFYHFWRYKTLKISDLYGDISVRWVERSLDKYEDIMPADILEMAVLIKKTITDAVIVVEEIKDYADPLLVVMLGHEKFYIACYERQHPPTGMED